jgi:hypothetical protein
MNPQQRHEAKNPHWKMSKEVHQKKKVLIFQDYTPLLVPLDWL